jgi:hypothetical protein
MKKKPKISVILSCYDEPLIFFKNALDSILNQSYKDFELILILDSPHNKELENEILNYIKKDKRIIFIKNKKNLGLAESLNIGIKKAKGKYLARMDADDIASRDRFKIQYEYLEKNTNVDLLFSWAEFIDENSKKIKDFKPSKNKIKNIKSYFLKEDLLIHPTLFCKSEILKKNKYDKKQKRSQDFELWIRLISKGYNFDLIEKKLLKYRIPSYKNLDNRINKIINFNKYALMVLKNNKNLKYFNNYYFFYFKFLILFYFLKLPKRFIKVLVLIKDIFNKNG